MSETLMSLSQIPLFQELTTDEIHNVFMQANMLEIKEGKEIFKQGSIGNALYLVKSGEIQLMYQDSKAPHPVMVEIAKAGDYFGEMSLVDDEPHSLSASALSNAVLVEIKSASFHILLEKEPAIALKFYRMFSKVLGERLRQRTMKQIPLFRDLSEEEIRRVFMHAGLIEIEEGKELFKQGSTGNSFYLVKSGEIALKYQSAKAPEPMLVEIAGPGDYFGEMSLVDSQPRSLSAEALCKSVLIEIESGPFHTLLEKEPTIALKFYRMFTKLMSDRLRLRTRDMVHYA